MKNKRKKEEGDRMRSLLVKLGVILIIGLALFSYAEVCGAEGAWVLWESYSNDGYLHWEVNDAFPSYEKCKQGQHIKCERLRETLLKDITKTQIKRVADNCPDTLIIFYKDSSYHYVEFDYKCFPDTIDPRK
jgi:hypothetical protein